MKEPTVLLENVTKKFGSVKAVDNVSFEIYDREIFGLLGPNGSGKTTTMRMILGVLSPSSGKVVVFGHEMPKERDRVVRRLGYVPQKFSLYEDLTVLENLEFYGKVFNMSGQKLWDRIKEMMEEFDLWRFRHRLAGKLSGGTKQRLAIAASLIHDPELIILDEPTAGVDPPLRRYFWDVFNKLRGEGKTLIVTTHYMDEAERCDRLAVMRQGRVAALGTPRDLKKLAIGGDLVEVVVDRAEALNAILGGDLVRKVERVENVSNGVRALLIVDDAPTALPKIVERLRSASFEVVEARELHVEFEEVFIRLTLGGEGVGDERNTHSR